MANQFISTKEAAAMLGIRATSTPRALRALGVEPERCDEERRRLYWPQAAVAAVARTYDSSRRARRINSHWSAGMFPQADPRPMMGAAQRAAVIQRARRLVAARQRRRHGSEVVF